MTKADQKLRDKIERILDLVSHKTEDGIRWAGDPNDLPTRCGINETIINHALEILWEEDEGK